MALQANLSHIKPPVRPQRGAALIIGLVLLVSLTIIGISALSTTSLEHRMAGNMGDLNLAFSAAETAGREAQAIIQSWQALPSETADCMGTDTSGGTVCVRLFDNTQWWEGKNHAWWVANTTQLANPIAGVNTQPYILVERVQFISDTLTKGYENKEKGTVYYRITSRGTGRSDDSQAIIQQTIAKKFN